MLRPAGRGDCRDTPGTIKASRTRKEAEMPPIIQNQTKPVLLTVKDLLHTLTPPAPPAPAAAPPVLTPVGVPRTPFTGRRVHFVGIGGSGMCGLAHMLLKFGALVSGTDRSQSAVTLRLAEVGANILYEQKAESVPAGTEIIVHSAAIKPEHAELVEGRSRRCEILKYAQMLGRVMSLKRGIAIAGTHGKSTTTAMTAHVLLAAQKDPSYVVGATCKQLGGSARSGGGDLFVVEACEYDRSFHNLRPHIGVALNVEEDHLDYYQKGIGEIVESFAKFLGQIDPQGLAIIAAADANCATAAKNIEAKVETYGVDMPADWQATGIRRFQGRAHFQVTYKGKKMGRLVLGLPGRHNVGNATVAAAIATHCGVAWEDIAAAVETFRGADRRSQLLGRFTLPEFPGDVPVTVVDDYGHHPTEIRTTLLALRDHYRPRRLVCIFQPHQHSRTRHLLDDFARSFNHADLTILPDIYFVRDSEADRQAVNSGTLVRRLQENGREAMYMPTFKEIVDHLMDHMLPGDLLVSMGAGPVWEVTDELVRRLRGTGTA
jgi:UDP-N-acetylmuramate--alanine ligase